MVYHQSLADHQIFDHAADNLSAEPWAFFLGRFQVARLSLVSDSKRRGHFALAISVLV